MAELEALINGYIRRYQHFEDLFIINCALPAYRAAYGNKAPSYKQLTAHRNMTQRAKPPDHLDEEPEAYWLAILDGGTSNVKMLVCQTYVTPCLMKSWSVSFGDFHPSGRIGKQL